MVFERNYALLMERFPGLALRLPRQSAHGAVGSDTQLVYVCGSFQCGVYERALHWMKGDRRRKLIFIEGDERRWADCLHSPSVTRALCDPQVIFAHREELDAFIEAFPFERVEVLGSEDMREEILQKAALAHAWHRDRLHGPVLFSHFVRNSARLPHSFYANALAGRFIGVPAVVCGAGPSLKEGCLRLKECEEKALLIAGGSTLAALGAQGIRPHFGIAVDPNQEEYFRFKNTFAFEVPLLYSTRVCPDIFRTVNGPFGYMRSGTGGALESWIEKELGLEETLIGEDLPCEAMSVTGLCLAWAQFLGCNPIFLHGVDLAYTGGDRYAEGVLHTVEQPGNGNPAAQDCILQKKDRKGIPVGTSVRWVMESSAFSQFAREHSETLFFNTTEGGIGFQNIPYLSLEEAMDRFCKRKENLRAWVQREIAQASMPKNSEAILQKQKKVLQNSLHRSVSLLEICAGLQQGSAVLAEIEWKEEMAYRTLFYDLEEVLHKEFAPTEPLPHRRRLLEWARAYAQAAQGEFPECGRTL